jgi:DNA ligase (NAD+)
MAALRAATTEELEAVPDIGSVVAASVRAFFDEPRNAALVDRLFELGVRMADPEVERTEAVLPQTLAGRTYVITGTLDAMSREAAAAEIEARGGKVTSSISRKTTGLIVGRDPGSKVEKARALGVPELGEAEFLALIMDGQASSS